MTIRTKAIMLDQGEVKEVSLDILATPGQLLKNEYGHTFYPAALIKNTRKNHLVSKQSGGLLVDGVYHALMSYEVMTGIKANREAILKPLLTFIGWDLLRIRSSEVKEEWENRKRLEAVLESNKI